MEKAKLQDHPAFSYQRRAFQKCRLPIRSKQAKEQVESPRKSLCGVPFSLPVLKPAHKPGRYRKAVPRQ